MRLKALLAAIAGVLLTLGLSAAPAAASTHRITSSYTCGKRSVSQRANGTWTYDELCTLTATVTGPASGYKVKISGGRHERVTLYLSAPLVIRNGVDQPHGMGAGHVRITLPYTINIGSVAAGYKVVYGWSVSLPAGQPRPVMRVVAVH